MANVTAPQFQQDVNKASEWANGDENTTVTMRLGQTARSPAKVIKDIENQANSAILAAANNFNLSPSGFDFATGGTLTSNNQTVEDASGNEWIYTLEIPEGGYIVTAGTTPTDPPYKQVTYTDHNNASNRNVDDAHISSAISNTDGSTSQDTHNIAKNLNAAFLVETIEDLTSITVSEGFVVNVSSFHQGTSKGGGVFTYTTGVHNGITFIDPSKILPNFEDETEVSSWLTSGGAVTGWKRVFNGELNTLQAGLDIEISNPTSNRLLIQKVFDVADAEGYKQVVIEAASKSTIVLVDDARLDYGIDNSALYYRNMLKQINPSTLSSNIINYGSCENVTVYNQRLDGDRDNNLVNLANRGNQFNFTVYNSENVLFIGGESLNAAQNHVQSTSENVTIRNMKFIKSGEHGLYLTLNSNNPKDRVAIEDCEISEWDLIGGNATVDAPWNAYAISCRDYKDSLIERTTFKPESSGYGYIQFFGEYDSTLGADEYQINKVKDCTFFDGTGMSSNTILCSSKTTRTSVVVEGGLMYGAGPTSSVDKVKGMTIDLSTQVNEFDRWNGFPSLLEDCKIYTGTSDCQPTSNFRMKGGEVIKKGVPANNAIFLNIFDSGIDFALIDGVKFVGFTEAKTFGLVRTKVGAKTILRNNEFENCSGRMFRTYSTLDSIVGNIDLGSTCEIYLSATPEFESLNSVTITTP